MRVPATVDSRKTPVPRSPTVPSDRRLPGLARKVQRWALNRRSATGNGATIVAPRRQRNIDHFSTPGNVFFERYLLA